MKSNELPEDDVDKQRGKRGIATIVIASGDVQVVGTAKINAPRRNPAAGRARLAWLKANDDGPEPIAQDDRDPVGKPDQ